jgi:hypothetical protein
MAFDKPTRARLQKLVNTCRNLLSDEFSIQLQKTYGVDPKTGEATPLSRLAHLDDKQRHTAEVLRLTMVHYLGAEANDAAHRIAVIDRILREQAFTVLNRLAALLMMEARGHLIESVSKVYQSKGFDLYKRIAGVALGETGQAYQIYLFSVFDELAQELPALFDRYAANSQLFPGESALRVVLEELNHFEITPLWAEDETIGWIYQYFNSKEERKAMRDASQAPRNSRELAVRNQFFTPRYVVEFLVDNTLGHLWFNATGGKTELRERCQYLLVKPDEQAQAPISVRDPRTLKLLDPACGSMHFGLYSFDLFLDIYREAWTWEQENGPGSLDVSTHLHSGFKPLSQTYTDQEAFLRDTPRLIIEHNIYGVDIDPRAAQIATLALWLRAQRAWHDDGVKAKQRPRIGQGNVVAAVAPPAEPELRLQFAAQLDERDAELFEKTLQMLKGLPELGILLKVERELPLLIHEVYIGKGSGLFAEQEKESWQLAENRLRLGLIEFAQSFQSTYQSQLFSQDALQGLRLIDLCREEFDVVVMNPPFGQATKNFEKYYKANYQESSIDELAATFFTRAVSLLRPGGLIGEISSRTMFFLYSLKDWRRDVLFSKAPLRIYADIGAGELDDALNETAIYVAQKGISTNEICHFGMFHQETNKAGALLSMTNGALKEGVFKRKFSDFEVLDDAPLCYWVSPSFLNHLENLTMLGTDVADVQMGLAPRDEFRYSRLWWEVQPKKVGINNKWVGYAKGGELSPYFSDVDLLLNSKGDLREIKADLNNKYPYLKGNLDWVLHPENNYFQDGLTFGQRTTFLRVSSLPAGCYFSVAGKAIFGKLQSNGALLQSINTPSAQYLISIRRERLELDPQYQEGAVARMPWPSLDNDTQRTLSALGEENSRLVSAVFSFDETTHRFSGIVDSIAYFTARQNAQDVVLKSETEADNIMSRLLGLSEMDNKYIQREILPRWEGRSVANWYEYSVGADEISFAVGAIFGRWDIRFSTKESKPEKLVDPFAPLPVCAPGMLINSQGLPASAESIPSDYVIPISWDGILVFDENNIADIVDRVRLVFRIVWREQADEIEALSCNALHIKDLRTYFESATGFFADHLKRYTKSSRKAPIYWPLSTASGSYTLWVYYPSLNNQILFTAVNDFLDGPNGKLTQVSRECAELRVKGSSRSSDEEKRYETLQTFEQELNDLRDTLLKIAPTYRPNHDDGVQIAAAPLWPLFRHKPWQKILKDTWAKMEKGDYDWAHLAMAYWPDRVREKCKTDKSLAIAHGLEHLYIEPEVKPKATSKKKKT